MFFGGNLNDFAKLAAFNNKFYFYYSEDVGSHGFVSTFDSDFSSNCHFTVSNLTHTKQENLTSNFSSSSLSVISEGLSVIVTTDVN